MFSSSPSIWSNMTVRQVVRVKIPNLTHFYGCEIFHNRTVKCVTLDILTLTPRVTIIPSLHGLSSTIFQPKPVYLPRKQIKEKLRICLVTVFIFYFRKLVFGNIKKKKQFSCIFQIKNMSGQLKLKKQFFKEKKKENTKICYYQCGGNEFIPNQVLSALGQAGSTLAPTCTDLLNPTSGRDASHPCLISTWLKEGCIIVCVM